jgi:formylmethanofuran dehydrogenase subunit A
VLRQIAAGNHERLRAYAAWLLGATKGFGLKLVNPGGVEVWKQGGGNVHNLDSRIEEFQVTPRQIISQLAQAAMDLALPHSIHIHCNNLGLPGNWKTTLETMQALEGRRAHLTHVQFHSYGGDADDQGTFCSHVPQLAAYVNEHPNLTVDVGQVLFGSTTSLTGDGPLGYYLHKVTGHKWFNGDIEQEAGCGIVPIVYKEKSMVHALQWAIGLEWYLLVQDPWRVAMSTDHPNGGSFLAYPEIVQLLMDRNYRQEILQRLPSRVRPRCTLMELDREYSLYEIAIITRAAPARILGLGHKGHLGPGADADITLYAPNADKRAMFALPRMVLKGGEVVVEQGEIRQNLFGKTVHVAPGYDEGLLPEIQKWFESYYTIQFANYPVAISYLAQGSTLVPCVPK